MARTGVPKSGGVATSSAARRRRTASSDTAAGSRTTTPSRPRATPAGAPHGVEDYEPGADALHGGNGRVRVQLGKPHDPATDLFIESSAAVGARRVDDINGSDDPRAGYGQYATRNGLHFSAADAYLHPALKRPNVRMLTHATVGKVTFAGDRRGV